VSLTTFSQLPAFFLLGALVGLGFMEVWSRGPAVWARTALSLMAGAGLGAALSGGVAYLSTDVGPPQILRAACAAWGGLWVLCSLVSLWRTNLIIGRSVDRFFLGLLVCLGVSVGVAYVCLLGVEAIVGPAWIYGAVPVLAAALYRLALLLMFLRANPVTQDAASHAIERRLSHGIAAAAGAAGVVTFDPFFRRRTQRPGGVRAFIAQIRPAKSPPRTKSPPRRGAAPQ
jgi:hypothetical protein